MHAFLNSPFNIGGLQLPNRLIQGPLAGFSCAPFRQMYAHYATPAYCVSEMISANDVLHKHQPDSRYLYRAPDENILCYQLSGHEPLTVANAALHLQALGADLIDLNCGCPKAKIRKKGAGSALLADHDRLFNIVRSVKRAISIPFTVKIRITGDSSDIDLAKGIEASGADALIVHGRRWTDDYDVPCDTTQIANIKRALSIPVIANGDIASSASLERTIANTGCDAFMIARAGCGRPWLYQHLLAATPDDAISITPRARLHCFMMHLEGLARLESAHKAMLHSKSLVRYYFRDMLSDAQLKAFYALDSIGAIETLLCETTPTINT